MSATKQEVAARLDFSGMSFVAAHASRAHFDRFSNEVTYAQSHVADHQAGQNADTCVEDHS